MSIGGFLSHLCSLPSIFFAPTATAGFASEAPTNSVFSAFLAPWCFISFARNFSLLPISRFLVPAFLWRTIRVYRRPSIFLRVIFFPRQQSPAVFARGQGEAEKYRVVFLRERWGAGARLPAARILSSVGLALAIFPIGGTSLCIFSAVRLAEESDSGSEV